MLVGPKYKICKRLGASVFEKCQTQKFQAAEARAPRRTRTKRGGGGDFGTQLLEKQKARFTYGLTESQFSRYVFEAMEKKGSETTGALMTRLESRLDNTIFRSGIVKTRRAARQLVGHGHITVNGRRLNIPSYKVEPGEVIAVRTESRTSPLFQNRTEVLAETKLPTWLETTQEGFGVMVKADPILPDTELPFNPAVIIQFYSR